MPLLGLTIDFTKSKKLMSLKIYQQKFPKLKYKGKKKNQKKKPEWNIQEWWDNLKGLTYS